MSLLNPQNPITIFLQTGRSFLQTPGPGTGIEFDDAIIALKRHSLVQLKDHDLSTMLERFNKLIREQMTDQIAILFEETAEHLKRYD